MTAPTRAPARRRIAPPDQQPGERRPHLRVVPPNTLTRAGRQRRARRSVVVLSSILVVAIFGVVAAHVFLSQQQFRLDRLEREAADQEARYERLRLRVAELEAPERVVAAAQELGMVPPETITYLASTRPTAPTPTEDEASEGEWATVKSHLSASRP